MAATAARLKKNCTHRNIPRLSIRPTSPQRPGEAGRKAIVVEM